jgi:hypothetical protein
MSFVRPSDQIRGNQGAGPLLSKKGMENPIHEVRCAIGMTLSLSGQVLEEIMA